METSKFYQYIVDQAFTWCRIYKPDGSLFATYNIDPSKGSDQPKDPVNAFIDVIKKFESNFPGRYKIDLKKTANTPETGLCRIDVQFGQVEESKLNGIEAHPEPQNIDQLKEQIKKELKIEAQAKEKEKEVQRLKEELAQSKSLPGQFAQIVQLLIEQFKQGKFVSPVPNKLQGTGIKVAGVNNDSDEQRIKEATEIFLTLMDVNTFCELAKKLQSNPSLMNLVKLV